MEIVAAEIVLLSGEGGTHDPPPVPTLLDDAPRPRQTRARGKGN